MEIVYPEKDEKQIAGGGSPMKIVVLDAATLGSDLDLSPLASLGDVSVFPTTAPEEVSSRIEGADTVIVNKVRLNEATLGQNRSVRLICLAATGYDNVDLACCRQHGIAVCNVIGYSTDSVAQLTVSMALYLIGHFGEYTRFVREGAYTGSGLANKLSPPFHELAGKTWGIAGYGNIGRKVGQIASAFGCRILAFKRSPLAEVKCVDLDTLCRESDILSVHLPLTEWTRGLFSGDQIAKVKHGCIFINVARGAVTDERALAEALRSGRLGGLGIDVYTQEPFPETHPFYSLKEDDRVCFTPHMAWGSVEAREKCLREIIQNIEAFRKGLRRSRVD